MILIIDDDSAVRSSLSFMLKRAGYEAQTVSGPREAMEVVRSVAPDLILMDMNFTLSTTGEEGLTLLRQVKIFRPETPVILMTAWGSIQLAVQGMQAGAFDFITKPWNNAALLQRIVRRNTQSLVQSTLQKHPDRQLLIWLQILTVFCKTEQGTAVYRGENKILFFSGMW